MPPCLSVFPFVIPPEKKEARSFPGAPPVSTRASPLSVEVSRELHVPLHRRARLTFQGRLTKGGQVELVEEVLLVRQVGRAQRDAPGVLGAAPLDARIEHLVGLRTGLRLRGIDGS